MSFLAFVCHWCIVFYFGLKIWVLHITKKKSGWNRFNIHFIQIKWLNLLINQGPSGCNILFCQDNAGGSSSDLVGIKNLKVCSLRLMQFLYGNLRHKKNQQGRPAWERVKSGSHPETFKLDARIVNTEVLFLRKQRSSSQGSWEDS